MSVSNPPRTSYRTSKQVSRETVFSHFCGGFFIVSKETNTHAAAEIPFIAFSPFFPKLLVGNKQGVPDFLKIKRQLTFFPKPRAHV